MIEKLLFHRQYALTIEDADGLGLVGKKYTNLKITFEIEKTSESSPNKAKIQVYNLTPQSRLSFSKKGLFIRLDAGYRNLIEPIFVGDVAKVHSKRSGADVITTFECGDGERQLVNAHFDGSFGAGTKLVVVYQALAAELGIDLGPILGIKDEAYDHGQSFSGSVRHILNELTRKQQLEWSIQNNTLQIIPVTAHTGEEAVVLNKNSGLIGVPSKKEDGYEFDSLINPKIQPGRLVKVESDSLNGFYKVRKCKIEGDTHGEKWSTHSEGVEVKNVQVIPTGQFKTVPK